MIRAALDTNVLVSGLAGIVLPASTPGALLRLLRTGKFELITSPAILAEIDRTLTKP